MSLNDWNLKPDAETWAFHQRQQAPYRSTVFFSEFIKPWMDKSKRVFDLGCGAGHATNYLGLSFPSVEILGLDVSEPLLKQAEVNCTAVNVDCAWGDMCSLRKDQCDGVVSIATLSWMPDYLEPLMEICTKLDPKWMAFSSLFYEGEITAKTIVDEPKRPRKSYYNVYSVPQMAEFLADYGYMCRDYKPFRIDANLSKSGNPHIMKSYTEGGKIFSGPLWLPWGFVAFEKVK